MMVTVPLSGVPAFSVPLTIITMTPVSIIPATAPVTIIPTAPVAIIPTAPVSVSMSPVSFDVSGSDGTADGATMTWVSNYLAGASAMSVDMAAIGSVD